MWSHVELGFHARLAFPTKGDREHRAHSRPQFHSGLTMAQGSSRSGAVTKCRRNAPGNDHYLMAQIRRWAISAAPGSRSTRAWQSSCVTAALRHTGPCALPCRGIARELSAATGAVAQTAQIFGFSSPESSTTAGCRPQACTAADLSCHGSHAHGACRVSPP